MLISSIVKVTYGLNLPEKDLRSREPPTHQFVVEFKPINSNGDSEQRDSSDENPGSQSPSQPSASSSTEAVNQRLHFTTRTESEAKDWTEGLQYLRTYKACKSTHYKTR